MLRLYGEIQSGEPAVVERAALELVGLLTVLEAKATDGDGRDPSAGRALAWGWLFAVDLDDGGHRRERLEKAHAAAMRHGVSGVGPYAALYLGEALRDAGDRPAATRILEETLEAFPDELDVRPMLLVLRGDLERDAGRFDDAQASFAAAEAAARGDSAFHAYARFSLEGGRGQTRIDMGLPDLALGPIEEAERRAGGEPHWEQAARLHRLSYELAVFDYAGVVRRVTAALGGEQDPTWRGLLLVRRGLARAMLAREATEPDEVAAAARADLELAAEAPDLPEEEALEVELLLADLALLTDDLERAEAWIDAASKRLGRRPAGPPEERARLAAHASRLALARGADRTDLARRRDALEGAFDDVAATWRDAQRPAGGIGFLHYDVQRLVLSELVRLELALDEERGPARGLEHVLAAQTLGTLAVRLEAGTSDVAALGALLGEGAGMLVLLPALDRGHVFAVDAQGVLHREIAPRKALEQAASALLGEVYTPPGAVAAATRLARIRPRAGALADLLLPPAVRARMRDWSGVYVVGAELAGDPLVECLPWGESWLGLEKAVAYLPSAPVGLALAARTRDAPFGRDLVLFAAPDQDAGGAKTPIPFTPADRRRMIDGLDAERVQVVAGDEAALARLVGADLSDARMLGLLAHGVADRERPRPVGIALAPGKEDDGVLWCDAAEGLRGVPPLVALWTCGAARGPRRRGDDGLTHLGGALLAAGARTVVLSKADVAYEPTLELAGHFARRVLVEGHPPAEAMRLARRELARSERWGDPFFWATFRVSGLGLRAF